MDKLNRWICDQIAKLDKNNGHKTHKGSLGMDLCLPYAGQPLSTISVKQLSSYYSAFCIPSLPATRPPPLLSCCWEGEHCYKRGGFPLSLMRTKQGFCPHFCGVMNVDSPYGSETVSALAIYCNPAKPYMFFINSVEGYTAYATEGVFS